MRKGVIVISFLLCLFAFSACGNRNSNNRDSSNAASQTPEKNTEITSSETDSHILIAYFGRMGNTDFPDDVDATTSASLVLGEDGNLQGTTEYMASFIQENLGGDLHLIQTAEPYPVDYDATVDQNHQEQQDSILPELSGVVENMEQYDVIFVGYPIWATSLPQPVVSFLAQYELSGKTIVPFCTHAGYGSGDSYEQIQELCPSAEVLDGLAVDAENISSAAEEVQNWLAGLPLETDESDSLADATKIRILVDGTEISAELNNSEAAKEFTSQLPLTVSMTRMGEHEYYGALDEPLTHVESLQTGYEVGDLAFWTPGDLFAVYFDEPEDDPEGLMILGHITSGLSVFEHMDTPVEMEIVLAE